MVIVCPLSLYCPSELPNPMVMVNGKTGRFRQLSACGTSGLGSVSGVGSASMVPAEASCEAQETNECWSSLEMTYVDHRNHICGFLDIKENE